MSTAIELQGVTKRYGDHEVLKGIDLRVEPAGSLIVLGGSGSGKSTLLRLLIGLTRPEEGRVRVAGCEVTACVESKLGDMRQQVGIVFQEGALFDSMSVRDNVAYRLREQGGWREAEIEERVLRLLGFVGLAHTIDQFPAELSGGMRRRVAIARALMGSPRIMLYDEPTAGLDPVTARTICDLLVKLRDLEGTTSVIVTHDLSAAYFLASTWARLGEAGNVVLESEQIDRCLVHTRFAMLHEGRIVFHGSLPELWASPVEIVRAFIN